MKSGRIYDISRNITHDMPVWPGDPSIDVQIKSSIEKGDGVNVSAIKMGLHTGTHVDAPLHYINEGKSIDEVDLSCFAGEAKVYVSESWKLISREEVIGLDIEKGDIILFKTANSKIGTDEPFYKDYIALSLEAAEYFAEKGVKTVGIDYLSIEEFISEGNPVHKALLGAGIAVIEGLCLAGIEPGEYFLSCLPLKIEGVEASPVRAVLIEK